MPRRAIILSVLTLLACLVSYAVIGGTNRYVAVGPLSEGMTVGSGAPWQASAWGVQRIDRDGRGDFEVGLRADQSGRIPFLRRVIHIPPEAEGIRVRAIVRAEGLTAGRQPWQDGRVQISTYTQSEGLLTYWPSRIAQLSTTRGWRSYERVIPVPQKAAVMVATIYNGADGGTLFVRDIEIEAVEERPQYRILRWGLIAAWGCIAAATAWLLLRPTSRLVRRLPLIAVSLVAVASVLTPQPFFMKVSDPLDERLKVWMDQLEQPPSTPAPADTKSLVKADTRSRTASSADPDERDPSGEEPARSTNSRPTRAPLPATPDARQQQSQASSPARSFTPRETTVHPLVTIKESIRELGIDGDDVTIKAVGHAVVFFVIAVTSFLAFPQTALVWRMAALLLFAISTECLQLFVITRTSSSTDLIIDAVGLVFGCFVGWVLLRLTSALRARSGSTAARGANVGGL